MVNRRSFLLAAAGAASMPLAARAGTAQRVVEIHRRPLVYGDPASTGYWTGTGPTLARLDSGKFLAAWNRPVPHGLVDRGDAFVQVFTAELAPDADAIDLGPSDGPPAVGATAWGCAAFFGEPKVRVATFDAFGAAKGEPKRLSGVGLPYAYRTPVVCAQPGYFVTAWSCKQPTLGRTGVRAAFINSMPGIWRSYFWAGGYTEDPAYEAEPCGVFSTESGPVYISQFKSATSAYFVWRQTKWGRLADPIVFGRRDRRSIRNDRATFALVAPGRIAGFWGEGDAIVGALFNADGSRLLDFEPIEAAYSGQPTLHPGANGIIRIADQRIFSALGSVVYDAATGRVLGRPIWPYPDHIGKLLSLTGNRFAVAGTDVDASFLAIYALV